MFVDYIFHNTPDLPPLGDGYLYQYVVGSNGIFVRAKRPEMEACVPVSVSLEAIRGLYPVKPYLRMRRKVPGPLLVSMFEKAYEAVGNEVLFYLQPLHVNYSDWLLCVPKQEQCAGSVHPENPYAGGVSTVIEAHSHHSMPAFFSRMDNEEEQTGFRIYSVIGDLSSRPTIFTRVGIYGQFWQIPSHWVYEIPAIIHDKIENNTVMEVGYEIDRS
jgi:PRTRC genetic system protein A